jgi:hypothetical protein
MRPGFSETDISAAIGTALFSTEIVNFGDVWFSKDGKNWTELNSKVIWKNRHEHSVVVFQDKLWLYGGYADALTSDAWTLELPHDWPQN